jgi:hypothetical protein
MQPFILLALTWKDYAGRSLIGERERLVQSAREGFAHLKFSVLTKSDARTFRMVVENSCTPWRRFKNLGEAALCFTCLMQRDRAGLKR